MLCSKTVVTVSHTSIGEYAVVEVHSPCTNSFFSVDFSGDSIGEEAELYAAFIRMRVAMIKEE